MFAPNDGMPMLTGLKVVDMTSIVFGPYCTQILADFGAEVTKIEAPGGDFFRYAGKPAQTKGMGPGFIALNRGKKSVLLDLKDAADAERLQTMIAEADIFIHNVRSEAIDRLGFGAEAMRALNPALIYVHCVGFGSDGPYDGLQAYDDVIQAASGATSLLPRVDGNPAPRYLPSLIADKVAGLHAAYAAMAAVIHRMRTDEGQVVEVPMFEAFTSFIMKEHLAGLTFDPPNAGAGYARQIDPDRQPFPTKDGYISIVPYRPGHFQLVIGLMGDAEFAAQERFSTPQGLTAALPELYAKIAELAPSRTTAEWLDVFREAEIPAMAVRDLDDMLDDPHLDATGFFTASQHPTEGKIRQTREPSRFSGWKADRLGHAPNLGEHSED
ncbi:CoA transferase [Pontixanthobacter aestiaquae]|uniref:CoA transferase n=1 Tax=Pontixanthobacter aestiaquae TaxID=1509367 RepID=A0A844Z5Z1_9SPHN|nr:CoA transferase [Pontixanthobacter aestiaquae]MDN3646775.1 CoA transferase [Pontixanthobacter aestiaquae]MXO82243.1 CoA transferase [Pontixanthobacter aestiaquae]